jgi:hypothetical protein
VLDGVERRLVTIDERFIANDRRLDSLEQRVAAGFREVLGHFNAISRHLGRLEQEYAIFQALRRIEALLAEERGRREILERNLAELKREVTPQARSGSSTTGLSGAGAMVLAP